MNAKKSTGPTSEAGKKITSQNALKTGAYSKSLILPGEDASEFQQLVEQFMQDFQPADIVEFEIVRDLAGLAWKKIRLENLEFKYTLNQLNRPLNISESFDFPLVKEEKLRLYSDSSKYTPNYFKELEEAIVFTEQMSYHFLKKIMTAEDLRCWSHDCPLLFQILEEALIDLELSNPTIKELLSLEYQLGDGTKDYVLNYVFQDAFETFKNEQGCFDLARDIQEQKQALQNKRLMELMKNHDMSRAFDDLRRNFFRTLGELRKHQKWRKESRVIDVTPTDAEDQ